MATKKGNRNSKESGITLLLGTVSLLFIVPMIGLAVDVGFLYAVKSRLQASVDGAALAAARALSIGASLSSQTTSAQNNAVNWFYANFPTNYFAAQNTVMGTSNVNVFASPNNPQLFNVTVTATTQVNTFFMKWLGFGATLVGSTGNASRRTVVAMLVLDRSGSMGTSCTDLKNAAKLFVGQFAAQRDYIGLVSFSDGFVVQSAPTLNFQSVLGYTNSSGTAAGAIDTIQCNGGTGSAQAISVAHNELIKINLPGALNTILFETDGLPNTLTLNWWDSTNSVAGIANGSNCQDAQNKTYALNGFRTLASMPPWSPAHTMGSSGYGTVSFPDIPAGAIGSMYSDDPGGSNGFTVMFNPYQTTVNQSSGNGNSSYITNSTANGCGFTGSHNSTSDFKWIPATDVYGNQVNPANAFKTPVTASGSHYQSGNWTTFHNAALNATDNAAYRARTNLGQASTTGLGPVTMFVIGLGGNGAVDFTLLQRIANDTDGDLYNSPTNYNPCASQPGCVNYPTQPQGTFIYSADRTKLVQSFQAIASQILRLSK